MTPRSPAVSVLMCKPAQKDRTKVVLVNQKNVPGRSRKIIANEMKYFLHNRCFEARPCGSHVGPLCRDSHGPSFRATLSRFVSDLSVLSRFVYDL